MSRRRRDADYKLVYIFIEPRSGELNVKVNIYELVITKPVATHCFSINFQVNIMILSGKFCVCLHFTLLFLSWRKHELRKRSTVFVKYNYTNT